jgi:hypothetical protein
LESSAFAFGQTSNTAFAESLRRLPCWYTQALSNNRRSLTRVLPGDLDEGGRPTLVLATVVLARWDWDGQLMGDVAALLTCPQLWAVNGAGNVDAVDLDAPAPRLTVSGDSPMRLLSLVSQAERAVTEGRRLLVSAEDYAADDFAVLEMLLPPTIRPKVTCGYRMLSQQSPVTLSCLEREASVAASVQRYEPTRIALSPYARVLRRCLETGDIPVETVLRYDRFGTGRVADRERLHSGSTAQGTGIGLQREPWHQPRVLVAAGLVLLVMVLSAFFLGRLVGGRDTEHRPTAAGPSVEATSRAADMGRVANELGRVAAAWRAYEEAGESRSGRNGKLADAVTQAIQRARQAMSGEPGLRGISPVLEDYERRLAHAIGASVRQPSTTQASAGTTTGMTRQDGNRGTKAGGPPTRPKAVHRRDGREKDQ